VRTNFRIRVPEVRLIDADGNQLGVVATHQARAMAEQRGLDLVEIAPEAKPPVCRITDYGKFRYEQEKREKEQRRHQSQTRVKEVKFHANVEEHDYQTKLRHTREFLAEGHRVKLSLFFRGRENAHQELGYELLKRAVQDCADIAQPEQMPTRIGRALITMVTPKRRQGPAAAAPAAPPVSSRPPA
jgi:translation initiation factor IF-3